MKPSSRHRPWKRPHKKQPLIVAGKQLGPKPRTWPGKLHLRFNREKGEMAITAEGWVTFVIALLMATIFFVIWRLH